MCSFGILPTSKMEIMEVSNLLKTSFAVGPDHRLIFSGPSMRQLKPYSKMKPTHIMLTSSA